jgi:ParB family chromosome partitioning protein
MTKKKSRLGKGLGALLGDVQATTRTETEKHAVSRSDQLQRKRPLTRTGYREIPVEQLQRGKYQPRMRIEKEALAELGESIKSQGVLQPLLVRPLARDQFEIIAGERRWRGAQLAGLTMVPAVVRDISDQAAMAVGLIENIQREDLNAIDQARGYKRLLEEFGLTHQEVSEAVGCSRTAVSNLLRLLALHPGVQRMVENQELDMGHARALLSLAEDLQPAAATQVVNKGLSVRQTERLVRNIANRDNTGKPGNKKKKNADITRLEEELSVRIGAKVFIQHGAGKGKLVIHYHSLDELDGILERIK